jgi:transcriptional regulator with XRE-family HTH domain
MMDTLVAPDINARIAARVREIRAARSMTLEALAEASGVSRSMISLIERGETSPTAVVLEKLSAGLGVTLASLFDWPVREGDPVSRRAEQAVWRDPGSGYLRRNVSPPSLSSPIQIVEVTFPPGARVAYESVPRTNAPHQQVWVLQGRIEVTVGDERYDLQAGDCLAFTLDRATSYRNPAARPARYAVVLALAPHAR